MSLGRYFHTLRYLRPIQLYGRVKFRVHRPRLDLRAAPPTRRPAAFWPADAWRPPLMQDPSTFRFLNVTGGVASTGDWDDPSRLRLWRYNLHYFDDLTAVDATARREWHRALIERWLREIPPGQGTAWEPYPTSLRIVNWIKAALTADRGQGPGLPPGAIDSLAAQTRWLARRLEIHLLGNHLWANAKALLFAGAFFSGPEADRWVRDGAALLGREIDEQILPDGGHFERSPMYHATLLEDVLDLVQLGRTLPACVPASLLARCGTVGSRMLRWLQVMTHPDGGPSFFNDAAFGIAPPYAWLAALAHRLDLPTDGRPLAPLEVLADSGYARLQNARATVICDVAPVGPDYLPGHAHADTLSFELSLDQDRVIVNGGTSTYERNAERLRQRGTAAHNTVVVDGVDSSEVWDSFRVARRARPHDVRSGQRDGAVWLEGAHDGYRRLAGRVTHRRKWTLGPDRLEIVDGLDGRFASATSVLHLHPLVAPDGPADARSIRLRRRDQPGVIRVSCSGSDAAIGLRSDTWHPEYGRTVPATALTVDFNGASLLTTVAW